MKKLAIGLGALVVVVIAAALVLPFVIPTETVKKELLSQVKQDGYDGIITLEACPAAMEHEDRAKAAENAERGLRYIREALIL